MSFSSFSWACGVVAPWCLGAGLLVSFTADAGQDASIGASIAPLAIRAAAMPPDLVPSLEPTPLIMDFGPQTTRMSSGGLSSGAYLSGNLGYFVSAFPRTGQDVRLLQARLYLGENSEFRTRPDEADPRAVLKPEARVFPQVDRSHKGDPIVGMRPTFGARLAPQNTPGAINPIDGLRARQMVFGRDEGGMASSFAIVPGDVPGPETVEHFEAWPDGENPTTQHTTAASSPRQGGSANTSMVRPAAIAARIQEGATPKIARAIALGSTTPAPLNQLPVEIVSGSPDLPTGRLAKLSGLTVAPRSDDRPDYAALIDQQKAEREEKCLAEAIYFEARSESEEGQAAVAQVVLNRVRSGLYPTSVCGVVYQNRHRRNACQFSFACEGKALRTNESESWQTALRIARDVTAGKTYLSEVGGSTHYHANYVRPRWAKALKKMDVIGNHIFYQLRPGQT